MCNQAVSVENLTDVGILSLERVLVNSKNNKGAQRTEAAMQQAVITLAQHKPLRQITVSELVEASGVSRGTFYVHYHDIYDMTEKMSDDLISQLDALLGTYPVSSESGIDFPRLCAALQFVQQNKQMTALLLGQDSEIAAHDRIGLVIRRHCLAAIGETYGTIDSAVVDAFSSFVVAGYLGLVRDWVARGCDTEPEELSLFIGYIITQGVRGLVKSEACLGASQSSAV